jgi:triacylglycerol lipase
MIYRGPTSGLDRFKPCCVLRIRPGTRNTQSPKQGLTMVATETTILVPGFNDDERFLAPLAWALGQQGFAAYCLSPQPSDGSIPLEALAEQLQTQIDERWGQEQPLNLVTFSMGGLICRVYLQWRGGLARTRRLITLATPHNGSYAAQVFRRPACVQMTPGSAFLAALNRDLTPLTQLNFTSIWTPLDLTIVPASSSHLPVGEMIRIFSPFHATFPRDPRVVRAVAKALLRPVAAWPQAIQQLSAPA